MATSPSSFPYDLRIGVTGHRNLPDPQGVAQAVDALLSHVQVTLETAAEFPRGDCGAPRCLMEQIVTFLARGVQLAWPEVPLSMQHTPPDQRTPINWTVISPIARGADRIVARSVLKRNNAKLQVVLPFAVDDYRQDFVDPADRAEFEELLKLDSAPTSLDGHYGRSQSGDSPAERENKHNQRNSGYLRVGHRVVDACEILIVIWDGQRAAGRGGTADIVEYAIDQDRVVLWVDSTNPSAPAQVLVKRSAESTRAAVSTTPSGVPRLPLPRTAKLLSSNFHQLAAYNRDSAFDPSEYQAIINRNVRALRETAAKVQFPEGVFSQWTEHFLPNYARADQLAVRYQSLYVRAAVGLYVLSALAVTIAVAQVLFFPQFLWLILFEILAMAFVVLLWGISKQEAWHEKWLHDRHLAERIRLAMFTSLCGMQPTTAQPHADLPFYPGPEGWMIDVVDDIKQSWSGVGVPPFEPLKRFVCDAWISDQTNFHQRNARQKHRAATMAHWGGLLLLSVTVVMAVLHLLDVGHQNTTDHVAASGIWLSLTITALAIVLPAWGAAIHAINVLRDRERIAARSKRMSEILSAIAVRTQQAATMPELGEQIAHAAKVMAAENHEWWVSLSYRDVKLPV